VLASASSPTLAHFALTGSESINLYGHHTFSLTGSNYGDTIFDYTNANYGSNTIIGGSGNDHIVLAGTSASIAYGGAGNDTMVASGSALDQLFGNDGNDALLALHTGAYLSGGAGNDILVNAALGTSADKAVVMAGGSGADSFIVAGTSNSLEGVSNTTISDLGTGDKIDLSFLETSSGTTSLVSGNLAGKASISTSGTTVNLSGFDSSSSNGSGSTPDSNHDVNTVLDSGSHLLAANTTSTATSTAIAAGFSSHTSLDLVSTFSPLTDVYHI